MAIRHPSHTFVATFAVAAAAILPLSAAIAQPAPAPSVVVVSLADSGVVMPYSDAGASDGSINLQVWDRVTPAGDYELAVCNDPGARVYMPKTTPTTIFQVDTATGTPCLPTSYNRGAGTIPRGCAEGFVEASGFCYENVPAGWTVKLGIASPPCPTGFTADGVGGCKKPASYGRGAGYAVWDETKCKKEHRAEGCEKNGAMWYPKCKEGFHNVGCCVCSPDCPSGWVDTGTSCTTPSKVLTPKPLNGCPADRIYTEGLCYKPCPKGYYGSGVFCKQQEKAPKK